jgi:protochlorophyllide reductase
MKRENSLCLFGLLTLGVLGVDAFQAAFSRSRTSQALCASTADGLNESRQVVLGVNRRNMILEVGGVALSSVLIGTPLPVAAAAAAATATAAAAAAAGLPSKTIVVTGANSGIGFEACKRLVEQGHQLVLACRTMKKAQDAVVRLSDAASSGILIPAECDLASMASIQKFAKSLPSMVGNAKLDVVCLNAGLSRNTGATDVARTADGFELTGELLWAFSAWIYSWGEGLLICLHLLYILLVGTNHLGHFLLSSLLLPMVQPEGGRIVVTASGVHDPESPGGAQGTPATLGGMQGFEILGKDCEMIDGGIFNADKAYKDSKVRVWCRKHMADCVQFWQLPFQLCNVLFARELQRRLLQEDGTKSISVNCFNPGLIVSTGLFRDQNAVFTKVSKESHYSSYSYL